VITNLILPCFIFSQIIKNFHISQYYLILTSLLGCSFLYLLGYYIGYFSMKLLGYTEKQSRFVGVIYSSPHTTSIPVILVGIIGPVLDKLTTIPAEIQLNAEQRAYLYIILNSIFANIWKWSGCYYLIQPEEENEENNQELISYKKFDENNKIESNKSEEFNFNQFFKKIINVPLISCIITLFITMFPSFQNMFNDPAGILNSSLVSVNIMVSKSYGFLVIFMLGITLYNTLSNSSENNNKNFLKGWFLILVTLIKLVIMPLIAFPIIIYIFKYLIKGDDIMLFLFLFMAQAPSAINMVVICTLKNAYEETLSMMMVAQYCISIISLTIGTSLVLYIIGNLNGVDMGGNFALQLLKLIGINI